MSEYTGQLDVVINGRIIGHITHPHPDRHDHHPLEDTPPIPRRVAS